MKKSDSKVINKKFKLKNKNILLGTVVTSMISIPFAIGISQVKVNYSLNSSTATNNKEKDQIFNEIKKSSVKSNYRIENNESKWKINFNNETKSFNSTKELSNFLSSTYNLQSEEYKVSSDLNKFIDQGTGILDISGDNSKYLSESTTTSTKVYEGKDNQVFASEEEAKKSYFESKNYLTFNGLYFNNKNDLNKYLQNEYFVNSKPQTNTIIIEAPNGNVSNPINLSNKTAYNDLEKFIKENAEIILEYTNADGKSISFTKQNYESIKTEISIKDLSYQHILSNQGESRYVIDNAMDDEFNLIGPYFYKGNLDIGNFTNKNMWKKVTGVSKQVYQENQVDSMIGNFFTSIINDDNQLNKEESKEENKVPTLFRTLLTVDGKKSLDEWYLDQLKAYDQNLWDQVVTNNMNLMNGKKYNTFYKIPVMYSFILQRLIDMNASWDIIETTFYYFGKVADFIQSCIDSIIMDENLLMGPNNKKFNVKEFFNIGNSEFDTSTSVSYFINEIKKYDKFVAAMSVYLGAVNNVNTLAGMIPFNTYSSRVLFENKVITREEFYKDSNYKAFEKIYNSYSKLNYEEFLKEFTKNSKNQAISSLANKSHKEIVEGLKKIIVIDNISIDAILHGVVSKNIITYEINKSALMGEIEKYNESKEIIQEGLLERLDVIGKLQDFLKLLENDKEGKIDPYWAYIMLNMNEVVTPSKQVFNSSVSITDPIVFAENAVRLSAASLISATIVADIINNLYWKAWKNSHESYMRLTSSINRAVRYAYRKVSQAYTNLKNKTKSWFYRVNDSVDGLTFIVEKWASLKYFKQLNKGLEFIKKAAPVFGAALAIFEVAMFVYDFLKVEETQNYYVYTTVDGTEFIWDGSKTISRYFGFDVQEVGSIDNMKLITPIQITTPQIEDFYFFDKVRYYSQEEIKPKLISYLFEGNSLLTNPHFNKKYTFVKNASNYDYKAFNTIEEMTQSVLKDLSVVKKEDGSIDSTKINNNSEFLKTSSFSFSNGLIVTNNNAINETIQNILNNIRNTKIAKLKIDSKANNDFVVPGKLWTDKGIVDNSNLASQYIIDNSANKFKDNANFKNEIDGKLITQESFVEVNRDKAEKEANDNLYKVFLTKTNVNSKDVLNSALTINNKFSELENAKTIKIYKIRYKGQELSFLDEGKALNYLNKISGVSKISNYVEKTSYSYNGMFFADEDILREWVYKNY